VPVEGTAPDAETNPDGGAGPDAEDEGGAVAPLAVAAPTIPTASRLAGGDRFQTSIAASQAAFPGGADTVLVVAGSAAVDGAIAASMAASLAAPLLYVNSGSVPMSISTELRRLQPTSIIVVGGPAVVTNDVLGQLDNITPDVRRFGGADRYETSRLALAGRGQTFDTVYLAGGANLVDVPLASATAAATDRGALIVNGTARPDSATIAALRNAGAQTVIVVGGLGTVSTQYASALASAGFDVSRRAGADRYTQTVLMAKERTVPAARAIVANSATDADVAVATALAAVTRQPLYYAIEKCVPDVVSQHLDGLGLSVTGVGGVYWLEAPVLANDACSAVKASRQSQLNAAIRSTMAQYPGTFSVTVRQLDGLGEVTHVSGGTRREPASMLKIFAAWAAYKRIEQGKATTSTMLPSGVALGTCIQIMIHVSDNYCHTDIVHWIGISQINAMIRGAGFTNTYYGSVPRGTSVLYAGNRSTSNDLAWLMERLAKGTILSKKYSDTIINIMRTQIWRSRIASGIPSAAHQASKPGALWIASGLLQGDTAIVNGTRYSYAISIIGDNGPPQAALRALSRTVYTHFHGGFGAAASYPVKQMVTRTRSVLSASPGGPAVTTLPVGVQLQVHDAQRVWYQVQYGSRKLWVYYTGLRNR
jgi:putative cell wall-binding protein